MALLINTDTYVCSWVGLEANAPLQVWHKVCSCPGSFQLQLSISGSSYVFLDLLTKFLGVLRSHKIQCFCICANVLVWYAPQRCCVKEFFITGCGLVWPNGP